jgi:hypothetical protein
MSINVIMSDSRVVTEDYRKMHNLCAAVTQQICNELNYKFTYYIPFSRKSKVHTCFNPTTQAPRHPAWSKVLACYQHLKNTSKCDLLVYLDTDAILLNTCSIENIAKKELNFSNDHPFKREKINTGFIVLKKDNITFNLLEEWYKVNDKFDLLKRWEQVEIINIAKRYNKNVYIDTSCVYLYNLKTKQEEFSLNSLHFLKHFCGKFNQHNVLKQYLDSKNFNIFENIKVNSKQFCTDKYCTLKKYK